MIKNKEQAAALNHSCWYLNVELALCLQSHSVNLTRIQISRLHLAVYSQFT